MLTNLKYDKLRSAIICLASYFITFAIEYSFARFAPGGSWYIFLSVINIVIVIVTGLLLSRKKDFHSIFISLSSIDFVLPGNFISSFVFSTNFDLFSSFLSQFTLQFFLLFLILKFVKKDFMAVGEESKDWGGLCAIPVLFYMVYTALSVWPLNMVENPQVIPGLLFFLLLMLVSFSCSVHFFTSRKKKNNQNMSIMFLAEYSDHIKNESKKITEMSDRIEEMSCAMLTVTSEIQELLELRKYDDIKILVDTLRNEAESMSSQRMCINSSLNSVLLEINELARKNSVSVEYKINVPESFGKAEFEYAVVCERLLENAVRGCAKIGAEYMHVNMFPSGGWQNLEIRVRVSDSFASEINSNERHSMNLKHKVIGTIDASLLVPEIDAFIQKYEVQRSLNFLDNHMVSEFNVKLN